MTKDSRYSRSLLSRFAPTGCEHPAVQLRQSHERNQGSPACQIGKILVGDWMILEQVGYNVGVDYDVVHAARSDRLCPRQSWSAARNSSIGSSSGQKSPSRILGSPMGPLPCCAISSSTLGLASKL